MALDEHEAEQSKQLRHALNGSGISVGNLWLHYFSIGGSVGEYEIHAYLGQLLSLPALERDILAHAANELINEQPPPSRLHAPYTDDLTSDRPHQHGTDAGDGGHQDQSRPGSRPHRLRKHLRF